jgi:hypothetical protein
MGSMEGSFENDTRVLGLRVDWRGDSPLTFHNLSDVAVELELESKLAGTRFDNLLDGSVSSGSVPGAGSPTLPPYGYFWLRPQAERR